MSKIPVQLLSHPLQYRPLFEMYDGLRSAWGERSVALLESLTGSGPNARSSLIAFGPVVTLSVTGTFVSLSGRSGVTRQVAEGLLAAQVVTRDGAGLRMSRESDLWNVLRCVRSTFSVNGGTADSFSFGFLGYFGYDVVRTIEELPLEITASGGQPTLMLSIFEGVILLDLLEQTAILRLSSAKGYWDQSSIADIENAIREASALKTVAVSDEVAPPVPAPRRIYRTTNAATYHKNVAIALEHIAAGDIYQVQLGHEIVVETAAAPLAVYQRLRVRNPSPYMYLLPIGDTTLVGASPESFIRIERGLISMRPIAGTARRGKTPEEDRALVERLKSDEKEMAEHVMLVDLCRNDIGRVCKPGTLRAEELMCVEQYSHVNHLVSSVVGARSDDADQFDVIAATFPAGTMTGAPKVRAMEIIERLETTRRDIYAGAVGLLDFSGYTNLALCIRSAFYRNGYYSLRASAGIVADSQPDREWSETFHKMGITFWAVTGNELEVEV